MILRFIKKHTVMCIAALAALVTCLIVPPDAEYLGYLDLKTLSCLFLTLAVVCALRNIKFFTILARKLVKLTGNLRLLTLMLVYITFMGYAGDRVTAWLHPEEDPRDTGYQILQSLYAIGSGGVFGLGLGKSRQKYLYLPFQYNDYIFAVICEEVGLFGALVIIGLFIALLVRGYRIALYARDRFATVLGAGLITLIGVQTVLNLGVVTNFLPSTGIALPFFSYGGTALAVNLAQMGVVLSISRQRYRITPVSQEDVV